MQIKRLSLISTFICLCLIVPCKVFATIIDPREVNLLAQSFIVDLELTALNGQFGSDTDAVLRYGANITPDGWTGTLQGSYLNQPLSVQYSGSYIPTSPTTADILYSSAGFYGPNQWSGSAAFLWEDPQFVGGLAQNGPFSIGIQGGVSLGTTILGLNIRAIKTIPPVGGGGTLTGEITAGFINDPFGVGSLIETGGFFELDQKTGKDRSGVVTKILWGIAERRSVLNTSQVFTPSQDFPFVPPPAPRLPGGGIPDPIVPPGGGGGFAPDPSVPGHEYMYVGVVPEPGAYFVFAMFILVIGWELLKKKPAVGIAGT